MVCLCVVVFVVVVVVVCVCLLLCFLFVCFSLQKTHLFRPSAVGIKLVGLFASTRERDYGISTPSQPRDHTDQGETRFIKPQRKSLLHCS